MTHPSDDRTAGRPRPDATLARIVRQYHRLSVQGPVGRWGLFGWSVAIVGLVLLGATVVWAALAAGSTSPARETLALRAVVPALVGLGTVAFGAWVRRWHGVDAEVGWVAGLLLVGATVFAAVSWWLSFVFGLALSSTELAGFLLNGAAVGVFPHAVLGLVVLYLQNRRREVGRQKDRLDSFSRVVAHDLRNPLNVAEGRVELAIEDPAGEHLPVAARALDRMERLVAETLTLARSGRAVADFESVTLERLAREAWATADVGESSLVVTADRSLHGDAGRLQQVFENLFRNATDHNDGPVTVTVGTTPTGFFVADDGRGIPAADRETVFEVGHTTARSSTGYGLAIVGDVAAAHGWSVAAVDAPTGGARFEFTVD